jgi:hypothetical protein
MTHAEPSPPEMTVDAGYPVRNSGFVMQRNGRWLSLNSNGKGAVLAKSNGGGDLAAV